MSLGRLPAAHAATHDLRRALWWAYEYAPAATDTLFQAGRRHIMPVLRHRLPVYRFTGRSVAGGATTTLITTGAAMTLDYLVERFFCEPPRSEPLGKVSLARLPGVLERLAPSADLLLACVPRAFAGYFGRRYLRVPALVGARLPLCESIPATLVHATGTVRYDARRAPASGYSWSFSREPADFERFYDEFYQPFVRQRFGPLAMLREREVLRRHFRLDGGIIWLRHDGGIVAGELVRARQGRLLALVEAMRLDWPNTAKPTAQFMLKYADCELALRHNLAEVDFGGAVPSLRDGALRSKRAWGASFHNTPENHREILIKWRQPYGPAVQHFFATAPLLFDSPGGLCTLAATPLGEPVDEQGAKELRNQLAPHGLTRFFVLDQAGPATVAPMAAASATSLLLDPMIDAYAINRLAATAR